MKTKNAVQLNDAKALKQIIHSLLLEIPEANLADIGEKRSHPRYAVNWHAMLCYADDYAWVPIYIRDISEEGIGFHHGTPLHTGNATVSFKFNDNQAVQLKIKILWCERMDRIWYFSGSEFLGVDNEIPAPW